MAGCVKFLCSNMHKYWLVVRASTGWLILMSEY